MRAILDATARYGARLKVAAGRGTRKAISLCLVLVVALAAGAERRSDAAETSGAGCSRDGKPLSGEVRFYSTGGTYAETLERVYFKPFERKCGVKVVSVTGRYSFEQLEQMVKAGFLQYDMGGTRLEYEFPLGIEKGLYHKLPDDFWDEIRSQMEPRGISDYGAWSTTYSIVIAYSTRALPEGFGRNGWADVWDVAKYPGKRSLQDDPRTMVLALLADGVPPERLYPIDYDRAFRKLNQIKPHVLFWWKAGDQPVQAILNGEIVAASAFNGRVWPAMEQGKPVAMSWKQNVFQFSWNVIVKGAPNLRNAEALLYFMQRAELQAQQAKETAYIGANRKALELLPKAAADALSPAHLGDAVVFDTRWWTENIKEATTRWTAWRASN